MVDAHPRTSLPDVYAIGDVVGGFQLAHAAYAEGEAALADILDRSGDPARSQRLSSSPLSGKRGF